MNALELALSVNPMSPDLLPKENQDDSTKAFCATGVGGGVDNSCSPHSGSQGPGLAEQGRTNIASEKTTPCENCLRVGVEEDRNHDGITENSRVGIGAFDVPPPPSVPRLPNLTPLERDVERRFIEKFEKDPQGVAADFRHFSEQTRRPGVPITFETDAAKKFSPDWNHSSLTLEERSQNRATLNCPLHQTANAICKLAFVQQLDLMKPGDEVMVTVGGCGAGKGWALDPEEKVQPALDMMGRSKAIWDSAGDQNATENPWIQQECEKRGLRANYLFVDADPYSRWADPKFGVVQRAGNPKDGRMVDAKVFADSYGIGAQNHYNFYQANKGNANASFVFVDARGKEPKYSSEFPKQALDVDRHDLVAFALKTLKESNASPYVKRGGSIGTRIWRAA